MLALLRIDFVYIPLGELPERALCVSKLLSHFFPVERLFTDYIGPPSLLVSLDVHWNRYVTVCSDMTFCSCGDVVIYRGRVTLPTIKRVRESRDALC